MSDPNLDAIRAAALREAEKSERLSKYLLGAAGVFELVVLVVVLLFLDWSDSTHVVIFLCACLVYAPLAFGLVALRAWLEGANRRVLAAIQLGETQA